MVGGGNYRTAAENGGLLRASIRGGGIRREVWAEEAGKALPGS